MMDINLTGQIAATLAENLKMPWYSPFINFGAGAIGGLVTGVITLKAVKMTNNASQKRDEQNRKEDARKMRRDELKKAYIEFMRIMNSSLILAHSGGAKDEDLKISRDELARCIAELLMVGDKEITDAIFSKLTKIDTTNAKDSFVSVFRELNDEIVPIMRDQLDEIG